MYKERKRNRRETILRRLADHCGSMTAFEERATSALWGEDDKYKKNTQKKKKKKTVALLQESREGDC